MVHFQAERKVNGEPRVPIKVRSPLGRRQVISALVRSFSRRKAKDKLAAPAEFFSAGD
jgi:hypothetical protein